MCCLVSIQSLILNLEQVLIPRASLAGHLCGIAAGLMYTGGLAPGAGPPASPRHTLVMCPNGSIADESQVMHGLESTHWLASADVNFFACAGMQ